MIQRFLIAFLLVFFVSFQMKAQRVTLIAENSKNNRLYAGIDNPLNINLNQQGFDSLQITTNNGQVLKDSSYFICIPHRSGRARLQLVGYRKNDTILLKTANLLVNSVPGAELKLGDKLIKDTKRITKEELINIGAFQIYFNDDIINYEDWFIIHDITFGYTIGGYFHRHINEGYQLSQETIKFIQELKEGSKITLKVRIEGQGKVLKTLPLYTTWIY